MVEYSKSIVSYVDILGFRQLLKRREPEVILQILQTLQRASLPDDSIPERPDAQYFNFSDHVVRVTPLPPEGSPERLSDLLYYELHMLAYIQLDLTNYGVSYSVPIRGSVTVGEVYASDGIIFGPALNRAYELESEVAVYPRIVVDTQIVEDRTRPDASAALRGGSEGRDGPTQCIRQDADGVWFVDYLDYAKDLCMFLEFEDGVTNYVGYLGQHREFVLDNASMLETLDRVSMKIGWLARYHNSVVHALPDACLAEYETSRESLLVPDKMVHFPPRA